MATDERVKHCKTDDEFAQAILDAIAEQARDEAGKAGLRNGEAEFTLKVSVKFTEPAGGNSGGATLKPIVGEICCRCVWAGRGKICRGECC